MGYTRPGGRGPATHTPPRGGEVHEEGDEGQRQIATPRPLRPLRRNEKDVGGGHRRQLLDHLAIRRRPAGGVGWNRVRGEAARPNKVDVGLSPEGRINFYNNAGTVNIIADVVGYYVDHNHDDR